MLAKDSVQLKQFFCDVLYNHITCARLTNRVSDGHEDTGISSGRSRIVAFGVA